MSCVIAGVGAQLIITWLGRSYCVTLSVGLRFELQSHHDQQPAVRIAELLQRFSWMRFTVDRDKRIAAAHLIKTGTQSVGTTLFRLGGRQPVTAHWLGA